VIISNNMAGVSSTVLGDRRWVKFGINRQISHQPTIFYLHQDLSSLIFRPAKEGLKYTELSCEGFHGGLLTVN